MGPFSYNDATNHCKSIGGYVAIIRSAEDNEYVKNVSNGQEVWIGVNDIKQEGKWVNSDEVTPVTKTFWNTGEPNNSNGNEDCTTSKHGAWNDIACAGQNKYAFVCTIKDAPLECMCSGLFPSVCICTCFFFKKNVFIFLRVFL